VKSHTAPIPAAVKVFAASERMNQLLIEHMEHLDPSAWIAQPPTQSHNRLRTIAAIFTHMHNVRCKWVRLTAPHFKVPAQLHRTHCSPQQAREALAASALRCTEMLDDSETIQTFRRDGWGAAWPFGIEMLCYMVSHEAHHRGQVCMLSHQLGFPIGNELTNRLWNWDRLWKDCGFPHGPGR
jgi:uncharacterized damage-inducible protein DinB